MSSASSAVTYTSVYTDSEPWRVFWGADEELSDGGSLRVIVYGYDGLPMLPVAPSSPDYSLYTLKYVAGSDPEEDPEEYEDHEIEDGLVDYPMDGGDDDNGDSYGDDADDEDEDDEEGEEHLAPADFIVVIPTDELVSPPEGTEPVMHGPAALPSPPLPPPLHMPPPVDRRDDIPETEMPPHKRLCLSTLGSRYVVGESSTARPTKGRGIDYGFVNTLDAEARRRGIGEDLYALLEDAHDSRTRISLRVIVDSQRVDLLMKDMIAHQETIQIVGEEAYVVREAWAHSIGLSQAVHSEIQTHQEQVEIAELRETDRRRQTQMVETLRVMGDMRREMGDMQAELLALQEQPRRARQPRGDARVFQISGCAIENRVKFATCTLLDAALTWWNSQIRSLGPDAYSMTWEVLKKKITDKYCPQGEIKKLETELWNLKVKENNVPAYTERFQELTLICTKFVADETEKIDKYVSELPDNIYRSVKASKPKTLDETTENNGANPKGNGCFECAAPGHFKSDSPKLKNKDGRKVNAPGWMYAVGNAEKRGNASRDPNSKVGTGTFLLNNRYASILFDTGAERSFISTAFSSLIDIVSTPLGNSYDVELADGKIVGVATIMRGCTLNFLNHPFNIDLMPVELGSFDVIIGMDWLRRCHVVIVCGEKLVRIPYGNETLTFHGNESNNGIESRLTITPSFLGQRSGAHMGVIS
nr:putative reverse transcriptase domain-containing protein [Tanacetum cinerariifolium]